jgi:hypothetical protein
MELLPQIIIKNVFLFQMKKSSGKVSGGKFKFYLGFPLQPIKSKVNNL